MTFLFLGFLIFLLLLGVVILVAVFLKISSLTFTGAPYIQIPEEVLPSIIKALDLKSDSKLYDLGCGDGRVLIAARLGRNRMLDLSAHGQEGDSLQTQHSVSSSYVGIDNAIFPIIVARRKIKKTGLNQFIKIVRQNFFKTDLKDATHIFVYLFPELINALLPKLERELRPGARVVSCDYQFENKKPIKIVDLNRPTGLGKFLYVYDF